MNKYTRPATWEDVINVVKLLQKYNVQFVLVGGYALLSHGYSRTTTDIDISVDPDVINSKKWILALSELPDGVTKELIGEKDPFDGDHKHAIRINDEFTIDIMPSVSGKKFKELKNYISTKTINNVEIPVLNLEGLLKVKSNSMRHKDIADCEIIKQLIDSLSEENLNDDQDKE